MPGIYTEKEIYGDALAAQKACTSQFNLAANECTHEDVRQTMMNNNMGLSLGIWDL